MFLHFKVKFVSVFMFGHTLRNILLAMHSSTASHSYSKLSDELLPYKFGRPYRGKPLHEDDFTLTTPVQPHSRYRQVAFVRSIYLLDLFIIKQLDLFCLPILPDGKTGHIQRE